MVQPQYGMAQLKRMIQRVVGGCGARESAMYSNRIRFWLDLWNGSHGATAYLGGVATQAQRTSPLRPTILAPTVSSWRPSQPRQYLCCSAVRPRAVQHRCIVQFKQWHSCVQFGAAVKHGCSVMLQCGAAGWLCGLHDPDIPVALSVYIPDRSLSPSIMVAALGVENLFLER